MYSLLSFTTKLSVMKIKSIFFVLIISPFFVIAQINYKEGYIITNAGDTLKGFINYREWYTNPAKIEFKQGTDNTITEVTPASAKEVTIASFDTYHRFEITVSMNNISFEKITDTVNLSNITKTVFLKQLLKGNFLNLYSYTDKLKKRFYVLESKKDVPEELQYVKILKEMQEQTLATYRKQLIQYAIKYGTYSAHLEERIQSAEYSEVNLKKVVSGINTNSENTVKPNHNKSESISYFAGLGIMQVKIKYNGSNLITSNGADANGNKYKRITTTNISPRLAAGINFYSKSWLQRFVVKAELSVYHFSSTTVSYTRRIGYNAEDQYTFHLNGLSFTVTPQVLYKFYSTSYLKMYIGTGLGINVLTTTKNEIEKVGINQPFPDNETITSFLPLKNINFALTGRAGVLLNRKFEFYIYGSTPVQYNVIDPEDFSVKSDVLALCVAYNF